MIRASAALVNERREMEVIYRTATAALILLESRLEEIVIRQSLKYFVKSFFPSQIIWEYSDGSNAIGKTKAMQADLRSFPIIYNY